MNTEQLLKMLDILVGERSYPGKNEAIAKVLNKLYRLMDETNGE